MRRIDAAQISFNKGMIERFKQDMPYERSGSFSSLLWLENYNPNFEAGSLIKRYGWQQYEEPHSGSPIWKEFTANKYYDYPFRIFTNSKYPRDEIFIHSAMLPTANPVYNNSFMLFFRRLVIENRGANDYEIPAEYTSDWLEVFEATGVLAFVPQWLNGEWVRALHEPFHDKQDYPGHFVIGTYKDSDRYGESMIFCTSLHGFPPNNSLRLDDQNGEIIDYDATYKKLAGGGEYVNRRFTDYMFPCYVWKFIDLSKKREKGDKYYWHGLTIDTKDREKYSIWKVKSPAMELVRNANIGQVVWNQSTGDFDPYPASVQENKDIELCWMPDKLYQLDNTANSSEGIGANSKGPSYFDDDFRDGRDLVFNDLNFIFTFEVPKFKNWEDRIKNRFPNDDVLIEDIDLGTPLDQGIYYTIKGPLKSCRIAYRDLPAKGENTRGVYALIQALPDYINSQLPRPWHYGEKIPFVLTAVIDGVETIIYRDEFKIPYEISSSTSCVPLLERLWLIRRDSIYHPLPDACKYNSRDYDIITSLEHAASDGRGGIRFVQNLFMYTLVNNCLRAASPLMDSEGDKFNWYMENILPFTLRISDTMFNKLLEYNISSINLYVSEPSEKRSQLRSQGIRNIMDPPELMYRLPAVEEYEENDALSHYRLVKEFIIEGLTKSVDFEYYEGEPRKTNSWFKDIDGRVYAVPTDDDDEPYDFLPDRYRGDAVDPSAATSPPKNWFRPDFMLWDYPAASKPLYIEGSGDYWDGLGARVISVIRGRTFLGGCIDGDGVEEQAKVRYSAVQSGRASPDIFNDEDSIQVGHEPLTAMMEFREQLLIFNRRQHFRIIIPNVYDVSTWEFLDAVDGQGTFGPKSVTLTPYGYCWANENGVWISDGRIPQNISASIESVYQRIANRAYHNFQSLIDPGDNLLSASHHIARYPEDFNPYLEVSYDNENDELIISAPVRRENKCIDVDYSSDDELDIDLNFTHHLMLIYNFGNKNWRAENFDLSDSAIKTYSRFGRMIIEEPYILSTRLGYYSDDIQIDLGRRSKGTVLDKYQTGGLPLTRKIIGALISHEIGDGISDSLLHSILVECSPADPISQKQNLNWKTYEYPIPYADPVLAYELRSRTWADQLVYNPWRDLIPANMTAKAGNQPAGYSANVFTCLMQTPGGLANPGEDMVGRESFAALAPLRTPFRRSRIQLCSDIIVKIRSLVIRTAMHERRIQ